MRDYFVNVQKERKICAVKHALFDVHLYRTRNSFGNDQRFKRHPVEGLLCLVNIFSLAQKNADKTRSSAVNGDIEVARADAEVV